MSAEQVCAVAGVGPGMGLAIAKRFAREGFEVAMLARRVAALDDFSAQIEATGGTARGYACDLTKPDAIFDAFDQISAELGPVDVLVYNASIWNPKAAMAIAPGEFHRDLHLCVTGALVAAQAVIDDMRAAGEGTLLFTGGGLALTPELGTPVPSLTAGKAALRGFVHALAGELRPEGLKVGTVTIAGTIAPGTAFDPDRIANAFWDLYQRPLDETPVEVVFKGQ